MLSSRNIKYLQNILQRGVEEFLKRCSEKNLNVLITQTLRDSEYQNYLYAKGRTEPGSIVTNARGGESYHNYGLAFDICKNVKGQEYDDLEFFKRCGEIWTEMGGTWGGNFKYFKDYPHFDLSNLISIEELQIGIKFDENKKMKWEDNMVSEREFLVNSEIVKLSSILYKNKNYIELRDLTKLGLSIDYDKERKLPIIENRK